MGNIVLTSYVPVKYKAGYSGGIGRAEQIHVVRQISNKAADSGDMNILVKEIISQGQMVRDIVEQRLREHRMEDEQMLRMVVADTEKEDRLEAMARMKASWLRSNRKDELTVSG